MSMTVEERLEDLGHHGVLYIDKYKDSLDQMKDNLSESNDFIFYIRDKDWRNEVKHCTVEEWKANSKDKNLFIDLDPKEWWEINYIRRELSKSNRNRVSVHRNKDREGVTSVVLWDDFDPTKMHIIESVESIQQCEINIATMAKNHSFPGIVTKTSSTRGSMFHKGKLDEGAVGDLIDKGLDGAKKRAEERQKKYGHAFQKKSFGRRIVNGNKRKRRK